MKIKKLIQLTISEMEHSVTEHKVFYHGSPNRLEILQPRNLHGDVDISDAVFLTPYKEYALVYISKWSNKDFGHGSLDSVIYMTEMYPGALQKIYGSKVGYIHTVTDIDTVERIRDSDWEYISRNDVIPSKIEKIPDCLKALQDSNIKLVEFDPDSQEFKSSIKAECNRLKKFSPDKKEQFINWRLNGAHPAVLKEFGKYGIVKLI